MADKDKKEESLENSLAWSKPIKIFLPQDDGSTKVYVVRTHAPTTLPLVRQNIVDQMREDGISVPQVSTYLRRWAIQEQDVQRIVLGYSGDAYPIAVLLDPLSLEGMRNTHEHLMHVRDLFEGKRILICPLGLEQSNSTLFKSVGNYQVY